MRLFVLILQLALALVVTAAVMPLLLVGVPAAREPAIGLALMAVIALSSFAVLALVWPKRRPR
jgi:hypothetical protein